MSRKLMAILVSSTLALGTVSTSAWSATESASQVVASSVKNTPPLAPAGAAGIRQAQGSEGHELWILGGFIVVFGLLILIDSGNGNDNEAPTGTH